MTCKLAIEIDEKRLSNYEIKRQKATEQKLKCKFIRIHVYWYSYFLIINNNGILLCHIYEKCCVQKFKC